MKKQKRKMFFKELVQDGRLDAWQFKTATGSPILYTRFKKQKGIYYPLAKHHVNMKPKPKSNKHLCVVYSKTYGRELYENVDIWPDETAKERLLEKLKGLTASQEDDVGIDIPKGIAASEDDNDDSPVEGLQSKPNDDKRHVTIVVTDTTGEESSPTEDPERTELHPDEKGEWPLKRSQSIDSRDNPFLPGGNLSKEADDILSKATIIRDTFILKDDSSAAKKQVSNDNSRENTRVSEGQGQTENQAPVTEDINQQIVPKTENAVVQNASPTKTRPKENGQVDTENSLTPGSVQIELADENKDKKKQKKCCVIM